MALVVEDGTGKADAGSWHSVATWKAYADAHGHSYEGKSDPEIEQALRRSTHYIVGNYEGQWPGDRLNGRDQALPWPRTDATDADGEVIGEDEIPRELLNAQAEAAVIELDTPGALAPSSTATEQIKREKVGPLEVEYVGAGGASAVPEVPIIDRMLAPILATTSRSGTSSFLQRA